MESDASPVVQQLWRIFTYYALHADPDQPLSLKVRMYTYIFIYIVPCSIYDVL